jgi:hypothetical protein
MEREWKIYTARHAGGKVGAPALIGDEYVYFLGHALDPPEEQWSLVIGDCVQNFRAALDHMVWQLASQEARTKHRTRLEFPIYSDQSLFNTEAPRTMVGVPVAGQRIVEQHQPFQLRARWQEHPLALLQELSNMDKHRRVHIGQPTVQRVIIDVETGPARHRLQTTWSAEEQRMRSGMVLARVPRQALDQYGTGLHTPVSTFLTIAFDDSGIATGRGVLGVLRQVNGTVGEVLDALDPFVAI